MSKDSGKTFAATGWDGTGKTHVDHRVVWVDPLNSAHILSGNDGAVSETWNAGRNWSQKNRIRARRFYDVAVDRDQPYNVMGGTQDNGAWIGPSQNRNSYGMFAADWRYCRRATASTSSATGGTRSSSTTRASSARRAART